MHKSNNYKKAVLEANKYAESMWETMDPCLIYSCKEYEKNYDEMHQSIIRLTYSYLKENYPEYAERYRRENNLNIKK